MRKALKFVTNLVSSPLLYIGVRLILGSIFIYAGLVKISDPKTFAAIISQYGLIPEVFLPPVAIGLPLIEFLAGVGLIFNIRGSITVIFGLLIMFIFVLWYGILRELNIDCGCFTTEELEGINSLKQAFYRDIIMIIGVIYLFIYKRIKIYKKEIPFLFFNKFNLRRFQNDT